MVLAARLDAEVKANKASVVTNHETSTDMLACTARGHSSAPKWGRCARKVHGQMFHEKNIIRSAGKRITFEEDRLQ